MRNEKEEKWRTDIQHESNYTCIACVIEIERKVKLRIKEARREIKRGIKATKSIFSFNGIKLRKMIHRKKLVLPGKAIFHEHINKFIQVFSSESSQIYSKSWSVIQVQNLMRVNPVVRGNFIIIANLIRTNLMIRTKPMIRAKVMVRTKMKMPNAKHAMVEINSPLC